MAERNVVQTIAYYAIDTSTNTGKTGDVANHTLRWVKDGTAAAPTNSPAEVDATNCPGLYKIALTATETDCKIGTLHGKSSTADIVITPQQFEFVSAASVDLASIGLDHLLSAAVSGSDVTDNSLFAKLVSSSATADWDTFDNTTESFQALRDRGDAAWTTGAGGSITQQIVCFPLIPNVIDLANTAPYRIGIRVINTLDDLPSTAEITPGTISIDRKAQGGTSWSSVVSDAACSELAGYIYYDEVFDSGTGYAAGDQLRIIFKSQSVTADSNTYELTGSNGAYFFTSIREDTSTVANAACDTALSDIGLDHLLGAAVTGTDITDDSIIAKLVSKEATADWDDFDNTSDSLQAVRDRGDSAWTTAGFGSISDILNVHPSIPTSIDLADTATHSLRLHLVNALDNLPSSAEITAGTIDIERKALGGTSWSTVVSGAACSKTDGAIYYDEVFDSGTGYAEGDSIRITFKGQKITVAANDYEITDSTGLSFTTAIRQTMRGTDSALLASAAPTNFGDLAITATTGRVTVGTNADKTAYTISGTKTTLDALNDLTAAAVNAEVDTALADYDGPTKAELDSAVSGLSTLGTSDLAAALTDIGLDHLFSAAASPSDLTSGSVLSDLLEDNSGTFRFKSGALVNAPDGDTKLDQIIADTEDIQSRIPSALVGGYMAADAVAISGATAAADDVEAKIGNLDDAITDVMSRLGLPAGASMSADVAAVKAETAAIVADTNELQTDNVPGLIAALNDLSAAQVNAEVDTALADYDPPTRTELTTDTAAIKDLLEADRHIDTATTPWQFVLTKKGTGGPGVGTELLRQDIKDVSDSNITATTTVIGRAVTP